MTFEQIFSGRLVLMSAQRHVAQAGIVYEPGQALIDSFVVDAYQKAFWILERKLCELEREFDDKLKRTRSATRRRQLDRRAQRQVTR